MGLEKAIASGKEHRKKYYDSRDFDRSCRSHGSCPYCQANRQYHTKKMMDAFVECYKHRFDFIDNLPPL